MYVIFFCEPFVLFRVNTIPVSDHEPCGLRVRRTSFLKLNKALLGILSGKLCIIHLLWRLSPLSHAICMKASADDAGRTTLKQAPSFNHVYALAMSASKGRAPLWRA